MSQSAGKLATYEDLHNIPEHMTGEIINGELVVTPRPSRRHTSAVSSLGYKIGPRYQFGEGGETGEWIIIIEPEIGLGENILVPDLAGWKTERFPVEEPHNWISVPPDWVCEVLSPGTVGKDKTKKLPIYAQYQVPYAWLLDPLEKTLEIFRLQGGVWTVAGLYGAADQVRAEPFQEIAIDLNDLWL